MMFSRFMNVAVCVSVLHSFLWPNNIPLYGYTTFYFHSPVDGYFCCFHFLALLNNVAVNICVQFLCDHVFSSLKYTPRSGIVGSYGNSVFNILRNCQTFAQRACIILYSYHVGMYMYESSSFSTSCATLVIVCLFYYRYCSGCEVISHYGFDLHFPDD